MNHSQLHLNVTRSIRFFMIKFLVIMSLIISCDNQQGNDQFHLPADFNPTESTGFIWSTDFNEIVPKLTGIISKKDLVTLYVQKDKDLSQIKSILKKHKSNLDNVEFVKTDKQPKNSWLRDFGPCYLTDDSGSKKVVDFNYYGKATVFNKELAAKENLPVVKSTLNSTGGARESNGAGTLILCESHELDTNSSKSKKEIEEELAEKLNIKKIIWLKQGIPQDDSQLNGPIYNNIYPNGLNGHVDEFCRFVNENTVLISSVSAEEAKKHPIMAEAKKRLDANYQILLNSTDQDGNKFNIIKVPFAPLFIFQEKTENTTRLFTYVTSYLNFIVTNSFVIVPSYSENLQDFNRQHYTEAEKKVREIFTEIYPDKEIVAVQATELNRYGGGFHCISINEPLASDTN